jgi:CBS domain-containing protein
MTAGDFMVTASEIMSRDVYIVKPSDNLATVRNLFMKKGISRVLVYDEEPLGMVTEKDLTKVFFEERRAIDEIRVSEVMSKGVLTAPSTSSPEEIARIMHENNTHGIPVLVDGKIDGIVTSRDLVSYFSKNYKSKLKIADIMDREAHEVKEFHSIFKAAKLMKDKTIDRLVVMRDRKPVGIISDRDISLASFGLRPSKVIFLRKAEHGPLHRHIHTYPLIVADLMKGDLYSIQPTMDAAFGAKVMTEKGIGSLLVKKGEKMLGIVTNHSYVNYLAKQA